MQKFLVTSAFKKLNYCKSSKKVSVLCCVCIHVLQYCHLMGHFQKSSLIVLAVALKCEHNCFQGTLICPKRLSQVEDIGLAHPPLSCLFKVLFHLMLMSVQVSILVSLHGFDTLFLIYLFVFVLFWVCLFVLKLFLYFIWFFVSYFNSINSFKLQSLRLYGLTVIF